MFRLENVSKRYRLKGQEVTALRPTDLEIQAGEFVTVVGQSGSGKTTLLCLLGGMLAPTQGKVWFNEESVYDKPVRDRAILRRQTIGFIFQTFNLVPYLSALENVQVPLMLAGVAPTAQQEIGARLLGRVGLESRLYHKPRELSTGQQQRVALARALANSPSVILADEPTGNLDPQSRREILDFLHDFHREGRTVIMVTHDPVAAAQNTRMLVLQDGAVLTPSEACMPPAA